MPLKFYFADQFFLLILDTIKFHFTTAIWYVNSANSANQTLNFGPYRPVQGNKV